MKSERISIVNERPNVWRIRESGRAHAVTYLGEEAPTIAQARELLAQICPKCGSEDYHHRHHHADWHAPEAGWNECEACGYATDPE